MCLICGRIPGAAVFLCAYNALSEITPRLHISSQKTTQTFLALSLIGYNAAQLPGELSPLPGMVIIGACSEDKNECSNAILKRRAG